MDRIVASGEFRHATAVQPFRPNPRLRCWFSMASQNGAGRRLAGGQVSNPCARHRSSLKARLKLAWVPHFFCGFCRKGTGFDVTSLSLRLEDFFARAAFSSRRVAMTFGAVNADECQGIQRRARSANPVSTSGWQRLSGRRLDT
jgi:hypothetical protein